MNPISQKAATGFSGNLTGRFARVFLVAFSLCVILSLGACSGEKEKPVAGTNTAKPATPSASDAPASGRITSVTASASASAPKNPPDMAVDNDITTWWSAGTGAPSWIQLDLGQPTNISKVRLNVSQSPAGPTVHKISGGLHLNGLTPIGTLEGTTTDKEWIELAKPAEDVRYIKIETTKSPSWIGWREIVVLK